MDYATAPTDFLASLVLSGTKQLDELPGFRRSAVAQRAEQIAAERAAKAKAAAERKLNPKKAKPKKEEKDAGKE